MRVSLVAVLACAVLGLTGSAAAADDPYAALLAPSGTCGPAEGQLKLDQSSARLVMTCLANYARVQSGLKPLRPNSTLNDAGNAKLAADVSCGVFSHEPCGRPFESVFATYLQGATSYQIGENIAWGTGSLGSPRQIMSAWLHSSGHRENILTPAFTEIGIGYVPDQVFQGYAGASLWSQEFGTRSPARASAGPAGAPGPQKPALKRRHVPHKKLTRRRSA